MNFIKISILLSILFISINTISAQDAASLLHDMDEIIAAPKDKEASVIMIITDKSGKVKKREASLKQKGKFKKLYRYTKPEKQAGIATLSLPDDAIWLYMPAFGKAVRINLLSKSQAFTGTDFSHEDMSGIPYLERYEPKFINSIHPEHYVIELSPKSKKSKYTKIVLTLNKTVHYPLKMEYFDKTNKHFKTATYAYEKKEGYWYAKEVFMTDLNKKHSTKIILTDVKFDQGISDEEFLVENLKQ